MQAQLQAQKLLAPRALPWKKVVAAVVGASAATALAACGEEGGADPQALIRTNSSEPQNPLIPADTNDVPGSTLVELIYSGLVYHDAEGNVHNDMAQEIAQEGPTKYKVTLKHDATFADGSPVTSKDFVDTWNAAVRETMLSAYFFEPIKGYKEGADKMEGLKVIDDHTFTIELSKPVSDFETRLAYTAFYPMHSSAFEDLDAYGQNPVGNGPYKLEQWNHNSNAVLVPNDKYQGDRKALNQGLDFVFYAQDDAAYADLLSNNLDVLTNIPASALANYEADLGDRAINQEAAIFQSITIPSNDKNFSGEAGKLRRQALSMAIDREEVTSTIFQGTRTPAVDFTSPVLNDAAGDLPGDEVLEYNPEKAKQLWKQAEEIQPFEGEFTVAYNSDGGHKDWVDAVVNFLRNNLGIDAVGAPYPDFKSLRDEVTQRKIEGAFRTGWQAVYPTPANFLEPMYATGADTNDGDYSNPKVDALLADAAAADSEQAATDKINQAQTILLEDLPAIPLWYTNATGGYSDQVDNVTFAWNSAPEYYSMTKGE